VIVFTMPSACGVYPSPGQSKQVSVRGAGSDIAKTMIGRSGDRAIDLELSSNYNLRDHFERGMFR